MHYLVADAKVLKFHDEIQNFASSVNMNIAKKHKDGHPKPTAEAALYPISANLFSLHRAIFSLCHDGWSFAAPIFLRTMLEMNLGILVITKSSECAEYFAFKYLYNFHKKNIKDENMPNVDKKEYRRQVDKALAILDKNCYEKAKKFIFQQKTRDWWYKPEYSGPDDILNELGNSRVRKVYNLFSGATHGGFFGLNYFKGQPDEVHPNPRKDKFSQNFVLTYSSQIMLESFYQRGFFGGLNLKEEFQDLWQKLQRLRSLLIK